jgi:hypothetical protein
MTPPPNQRAADSPKKGIADKEITKEITEGEFHHRQGRQRFN